MKQAVDERNRRPWNNKGDRGLGDGPPRMRSGYGRQQQPPFANRGGGWNRGEHGITSHQEAMVAEATGQDITRVRSRKK